MVVFHSSVGCLMARWTVVGAALLAPIFYTGMAILCYRCHSTVNKNCGPFFKPNGVEINYNCTNVCALQRQKAIPKIGQVEAVRRDCLEPGPAIVQLVGLNSSIGCRWWTNLQQNYTAYYCFCDTDLCNAAPPAVRTAGWAQLAGGLGPRWTPTGLRDVLAKVFALPTTLAAAAVVYSVVR